MIRRRLIEPLDPRRPLPDALGWYVLTTEPKREFHVAHWLEDERRAFSLVPLIYRMQGRRWRGARRNIKARQVEMPLIPRIVVAGFARVPQPTALAESCRFITGVLGIDGEPVPMRHGEAEKLRDISAELMLPKPECTLKPGDMARINAPGMWDDQRIVPIKSLHGRWAKVIQSWFGSEREVDVELDKLEAA